MAAAVACGILTGMAVGPFSVQRLEPETLMERAELPGGRHIELRSSKRVTYAVVDGRGVVVKTKNLLTGRAEAEIWPTRKVAQAQADGLNARDWA